MEINRVSVKIAGPAGEGILSAGRVLAKICARGGLHVVTENERPSLIRGGHNQFMIRAEAEPINSHIDLYNLLLALDKQSVQMHAQELSHGGGIIYDSDTIPLEQHETGRDDVRLYPVPMRKIMEEIGAGPIVENVIALGAAVAVLDYDLAILEQVLKETYSKHPEALLQDLQAAKHGYDHIKQQHPGSFTNKLEPIEAEPRMLINGLQAIDLGALKAGVSFISQYPMTPSTGVIQGFTPIAEKYGVAIIQTEDEIASMNMAIGAAFAGVRAMTATSGGGFALMNEALSLAGMTETPLVTILVTRGNPATGLPTRTEQSDLQFVLNSGHGEFPHVVIAPSCPSSCYTEAQRAFNIAERFQTPVTLLLDRHVAETFHTIPSLPEDLPIDRGEWQNGDGPRYQWNDETGISPRIIPGTPNKRFRATGNEHEPSGLMNDDRATRNRMMEKRQRKMTGILQALAPPVRDRNFLSFDSRLTRCSGTISDSSVGSHASSGFLNSQERRPAGLGAAERSQNPNSGTRSRRYEHTPHRRLQPKWAHEAAERAAALGGPRGDRASAFARCLRIASTTACSVMNAITFISEPHEGHTSGSTS